MRTGNECLLCLTRQAVAAAGLSSEDPAIRQRVANEIGKLIGCLDPSLTPPENAVTVYAKIAEITGINDPYKHLRQESNRMALGLRDSIRNRIRRSGQPFRTAVHYAVAANIIDYGTGRDFDAMRRLSDCLGQDLLFDDTERLRLELEKGAGRKLLYLADNSGELVFDGLLVEQIKNMGWEVTAAVKSTPILNDATLEDAEECGMQDICRVITNGTGCPGTPLSSCSEEFRSFFHESDLIISKGQGNFETLSEADRPIYFLLTVKCAAVGKQIADMRQGDAADRIENGEMIVMKGDGGC
ncbi:MAG: ARMT1-like domain-containing protein [Desulfobulbaceae bacterium]|nr:ARMT1-like domain-containing protein [Desulfobulbaceae bacterium]